MLWCMAMLNVLCLAMYNDYMSATFMIPITWFYATYHYQITLLKAAIIFKISLVALLAFYYLDN